MDELKLKPIGVIRSSYSKKYEAPKQPNIEHVQHAIIELNPHENFETALSDLSGFSHIWLIYWFHQNSHWKPKVLPPRKTREKKGVFATRSPYRPNPIGISCVRLISIKGRKLEIEDHDLLDGTPILDIKPYLSYSDSQPDATLGWIDDIDESRRTVEYQNKSKAQLDWLNDHGIPFFSEIERRLSYDPFPHPYRRITQFDTHYQMRYKEWCCNYQIESDRILIMNVYSGFSEEKQEASENLLHQQFSEQFPA